MPDGGTHTTINLLTLGGLGLGYVLLFAHGPVNVSHLPASVVGFGGGFLVGTLLITPDLDFGGRVRTVARRNWGILEFIWLPLSLFVKHRGITHTYFRGSSLLLCYAAAIISLLAYGLWSLLKVSNIHLPALHWPGPGPLLTFWVGYFIAYGIHLWLDGYRPWDTRHW